MYCSTIYFAHFFTDVAFPSWYSFQIEKERIKTKTQKSEKFHVWYAYLTQKVAPKFVTLEGTIKAAIGKAKVLPGNEGGVVVIKAVGFVNPNEDTYEEFKDDGV